MVLNDKDEVVSGYDEQDDDLKPLPDLNDSKKTSPSGSDYDSVEEDDDFEPLPNFIPSDRQKSTKVEESSRELSVLPAKDHIWQINDETIEDAEFTRIINDDSVHYENKNTGLDSSLITPNDHTKAKQESTVHDQADPDSKVSNDVVVDASKNDESVNSTTAADDHAKPDVDEIIEDLRMSTESDFSTSNSDDLNNTPATPDLSNDDTVTLDKVTYEAMMSVAQQIASGDAHIVGDEELKRINEAVQNAAAQQAAGALGSGVTQGQQQVKTGAQALAEGSMSVLGGAAALTGATLKASGKVASFVGNTLRDSISSEDQSSNTNADAVAVLPRISEYRVMQTEKAENAYFEAMQKMWNSGNLPNVREAIEKRARDTGLSVEDVMDKMKPNGEMADLHDQFRDAVATSSDAQAHKKTMDKALDGWLRQYGRGQEELLNPETNGSTYLEGLRDRLDKSHARMGEKTSNTPLFEDEEKSHSEKFRETIAKIMEKLKEITKDFVNMVRGNKVSEADSAPSP